MKYVSKAVKVLWRSLLQTRRKIGTVATAGLLVMFLRILWHIGWTTSGQIAKATRLSVQNKFSDALRRTLYTEIRTQSAIEVVALIQKGFNVTWDKRWIDDIHGMPGPFIVVANHNNTVEIPALMALLAEVGIRNLKFVSKIGLGKAPIVGFLLRESGDALIHRSKELGDLHTICQSGMQAFQDGASYAIFPEGTRFLGPTPGCEFTRVGPPKLGGFRELLRAYPNTQILAVCFDWVNMKPGQGRTMVDIGDYYHAHLRTTCKVFEPMAVHDAEVGLRKIFCWFEDTLGQEEDVLEARSISPRTNAAGA